MCSLFKLHILLKTITGIELAVRSSKVIAGLEPTETNLLLQAIGTAIDKKLDSTQYVNEIKTGKKPHAALNTQHEDDNKKKRIVKTKEKSLLNSDNNKRDEKTKTLSNTPRIKKSQQNAVTGTKTSEKGKSNKISSSRESKDNKGTKEKTKKSKEQTSTPRIEAKPLTDGTINENVEDVMKENVIPTRPDIILDVNNVKESVSEALVEKEAARDEILEVKTLNDNINEGTDLNTEKIESPSVPTKLERVKSAKPRSAHLRASNNIQNSAVVSSVENASDEISETNTKNKETTGEETNQNLIRELTNVRPRSSLRPPSVRPSSARPGAPRLRMDTSLSEGEVVPLGKVNVILESFANNKDADDEETVTIQTISEPEFQPPVLQLPADKGHLVEQILEQIQLDDVVEHVKPTINIEWEQNGLRNRNATNKEIEQLKSAIQTLTRTANPLGKLVNYLHEDIDAMHSELDMWIASGRQAMTEVVNQKRISDESNRPLQLQLEEIEENIRKLQREIVSVHGNILHNETRIRDLLTK